MHEASPVILLLAADNRAQAALELVGKLHPILIHFPIALVVVACALEFVRALRRDAIFSRTGFTCLSIAAFAAVAAATSGWLLADRESPGPDSAVIGTHRWLGIAATALAVLSVALGLWSRRTINRRPLVAYRTALLLCTAALVVGGHFGGIIVRGADYYDAPVRTLLGVPAEAVIAQPPLAPTPAAPIVLSPDIQSRALEILDTSCIDCHGDVKRRGSLRLDSREALITGGKGGPAIIPGDADNSPLILRVRGQGGKDRMPLGEPALPDSDIDALVQWINAGAPWPKGLAAATPDKEQAHWAYVAPVRPSVPIAPGAANDIDNIVLARLAKEGLKPSPPAEPGPLLRRLTLDLTGLPPTPEEIDAFIADPSEAAYQRAVDRLLASPAYGERWARPWLDLARYADSRGYEKDQTWSMSPYRDWVINALNADMPYDEFTIQQLAGDLLPDATLDQRIATGFHRLAMVNEEGGVDPEEARVVTVADRTDTTASVWLGATMGCARCHDHKFDPISTREYYSFFAYFNNSPIETAQVGDGETRVIGETFALPRPDQQELLAREAALAEKLTNTTPDDSARTANEQALNEVRSLLKATRTTQVMRELDTPRQTHIMIRGNFLSPGDPVQPGTPAVLPPLPADASPNRLALARWIVARDNPLTARVHANRIWSTYFGRGLVETEEDFGTRSSPPSHPELLDLLAVHFMDNHWSQKALHRLIVTSNTYRQSSNITPELLTRDPQNILLARGPRFRLEAEAIRDSSLALGGLLAPTLGGSSVMPPQPDGIWGQPYSGERWTTSEGPDRYRRGIYTFWKRSSPYPAFTTFDAPARQVTCTRRARTNTPLQALVTLNDPAFMECALGLARRTLAATPDDTARIRWAFKACTARDPSPAETDRLVTLLESQRQAFAADSAAAQQLTGTPDNAPELAAWTMVANVLLNLDEVLTKG